MPKEDCKYWDKCYQKNEVHLKKYNHPKKSDELVETGGKGAIKAPKPMLADSAVEKKATTRSENSASANDNSPSDEARTTSREEIDTSELHQEVMRNVSGKNYTEIWQKRIRLSTEVEYNDLLKTNEFIRHKFLVEMPPDFYEFWNFLGDLRPNSTGDKILDYMEKQFQLLLVGPFEYLAGRFHKATIREPGDYLRHWRFYYDPPEFQTVFVKKSTGVHYGYWRDEPSDKDKLLLARNDVSKNCEFEFIAGNAFDAFRYYLEHDFASSPFTAAMVASTKKNITKYLSLHDDFKLNQLDVLCKERSVKIVAKTFHRAGIVVPFVAKSQLGYRPLIVSDAELKQIIKLFETAGGKAVKNYGADADESVKTAVTEKLLPIATAANIALDECDFGTSLELGIDLFCSGRTELHELAQSLLVPAYTLLDRPQFIAISKAHMEKRSKAYNLSIFDLEEVE